MRHCISNIHFNIYNNRVIISSENKPLNFIKGSDMHLHAITGTCSTKDNAVERHNQSVSNFDEKASDNPDILGVTMVV